MGHSVPAVRIYQLAVAEGYQRNGIGSLLIYHAFSVVDKLREIVPCPQIIVVAYEDAVDFYARFGFKQASHKAQVWFEPQVFMIAALHADI